MSTPTPSFWISFRRGACSMAGRRHPLEDVEQDVGVMHFPGECLFVRLIDDGDAQPLVLERGDRGAETGRGAILQDGFHCSCKSFNRRSGDQEVLFSTEFS